MQLCCQLVCKAWRYALDARRWPLGRLHLDMYMFPEAALGAAEWVLHVRPGVQRLELDLSGYMATLENEEQPLAWGSPEVQAAHASLLALQPIGVSGTHLGVGVSGTHMGLVHIGMSLLVRMRRIPAAPV